MNLLIGNGPFCFNTRSSALGSRLLRWRILDLASKKLSVSHEFGGNREIFHWNDRGEHALQH